MIKYRNLIPTCAAILFGFALLGACNTIEGAGEDIEAAGDSIEDSAENNKNY